MNGCLALRADLKDYIVDVWGATIFGHNAYEAIVDIPKPVNLWEVANGISDIFKVRVDTRRYYFTSADVDTAIANGGVIELTKAQVLSRIQDKLSE